MWWKCVGYHRSQISTNVNPQIEAKQVLHWTSCSWWQRIFQNSTFEEKKVFKDSRRRKMRVASKFKVGFSVNAFYPTALDTWQSIWKDIKSTFHILFYTHLIGENDHKTDEERINIRREESLKAITILIPSEKWIYLYLCQFSVIRCSKLSILDMWIIIPISFWGYFRLSAVTILGRANLNWIEWK